jgi:hypothetical protein
MTLFEGQSREQLRTAYRKAWRRHLEGLPLQPLEAQLADLIAAHPEYQPLLTDDDSVHREFDAGSGQGNPFLHLGLHAALREQLATDRPAGIALIHRLLAARVGDAHTAEHRMIEVLAQILAEAQRSALPPRESVYLERLRRL